MAANNDILFWPHSPIQSRNFVVYDKPVRIIGLVPAGHSVCVWRVYDGVDDECNTEKVPDIPVLCCDKCGPLSLWKQEYADCPSGYLTQSEILINSSGVYYLTYCCEQSDPAPDLVTEWYYTYATFLAGVLASNGELSGEDRFRNVTTLGFAYIDNLGSDEKANLMALTTDDLITLTFTQDTVEYVMVLKLTGEPTDNVGNSKVDVPCTLIQGDGDLQVGLASTMACTYPDNVASPPLTCDTVPEDVHVWKRVELIEGDC